MSHDLKIPARIELNVLPADEPNRPTLGFVIRERNGFEITKDLETEAPITERDGIKIGDMVYVPAMSSDGYHVMKVEAGGHDGELRARSEEGYLGILKFGADDRNAWTCIGLVNPRVTKLSITRDEP
jgi:hypothetical protein